MWLGRIQKGPFAHEGLFFRPNITPASRILHLLSPSDNNSSRMVTLSYFTDKQINPEKLSDSVEATQPFPRLGHGSLILSQTSISICGVFLFWACERAVGEGRVGGGGLFLARASQHI